MTKQTIMKAKNNKIIHLDVGGIFPMNVYVSENANVLDKIYKKITKSKDSFFEGEDLSTYRALTSWTKNDFNALFVIYTESLNDLSLMAHEFAHIALIYIMEMLHQEISPKDEIVPYFIQHLIWLYLDKIKKVVN